ncbi:MAG TPA: hypothetical protein VHH73_18230, partial [Verrucomicrobiae bacterium]|nr:hypothetical protein [Verrucomicrobiae bacterium]
TDVSLKRSIAEKANLVPANTPTNATFVRLPAFAKVEGTLGAPKTETDKLVISGIVLKSAIGIPGRVGGKAGELLQGVGNFLTGENKNAAATDPKATTPPPNAPAPNQPAPANPAPAPAPVTPKPVTPPTTGTPAPANPAPAEDPQKKKVNPLDVLRDVLEKNKAKENPEPKKQQ